MSNFLLLSALLSSLAVLARGQGYYGCNSSWVLTPNSGIYGGAVQRSVQTENECRVACYRNISCVAIDWNQMHDIGDRCYLLSTSGPLNTWPGVNHWNYNRTAPCAGVCGTWTSTPNTGVYGGVEQPSVTTEEGCKSACANNRSCIGVDWNSNNAPGHQCFFQFSAGIRFSSNGVTHWDYNSTAGCTNACGSWTPAENTGVYGGTELPSVTSEQDCKTACVNDPVCLGVDWNRNNAPGHQCFLQYNAGITYTSIGVTHWTYNRTASCLTSCTDYFTLSYNTGIPSGVRQPNAYNLTDCKLACIYTVDCVGLDWNPGNNAGDQCYIHSTSGPTYTWQNVYHYEFNRTACNAAANPTTGPGLTCYWIPYGNSHIYGGTVNNQSATDSDCKAACLRTPGCQSIDFVPPNPPGSKCFLINTQVGRQMANWEVTHYDYVCQMTAAPSGTGGPSTPTCWTSQLNTNAPSGIPSPSSTTVSSCMATCVTSGSCKGIDWDRTQPTADRSCYYFTSVPTTKSAQGVDHYFYNC